MGRATRGCGCAVAVLVVVIAAAGAVYWKFVRPWLRSRMPLVFHDDELVWAPGIGVASDFRAQATEPALLFSRNDAAGRPGNRVK